MAMSISPRIAVSLLLLGGSLFAAPAFAQSGGGSGPTTPAAPGSATATISSCQVAADQADRSATFSGQMVATATSTAMQMRIDLLSRSSDSAAFARVSAPGLGVWRRAAAGVSIYRYVREVTNLPAPAQYRAAFSYRWLGAQSRVLRHASRLTSICLQPDERPLLAVASVAISPSPSSLDAEYSITLHNAGRGPAGPFDVALTVNGVQQPALVVQSLGAGMRTVLPVAAPRCTHDSPVVVTLDTQNAISEAPGGGLPKTVSCPLAAAPPSGTTGPAS